MIEQIRHLQYPEKVNGKTIFRKVPATIIDEGKRLAIKTDRNQRIIEEIKSMSGPRWHGYDKPKPRFVWTVDNNERNRFQLAYLNGKNPYARFDQPLVAFTPRRNCLYSHQIEMIKHGLTVRTGIWAVEMGMGKTCAAFELAEAVNPANALWIGTKSSLASTRVEFRKWWPKIDFEYYTYEGLKKLIENWPAGTRAPQLVIFDEASRIKSEKAQRSKAAMHLANSMREEWGEEAYIILMTGTPAPKNPLDWWHLCEVACPGFIREGDVSKFRNRLGIVIKKEGNTGGIYPEVVAWLDDENKCAVCGKFKDEGDHDLDSAYEYHRFQKSRNEISFLYERLKGLVVVQMKKDYLSELPEKIYKRLYCQPSQDMLNALEIIKAKSERAIQALTLSRELSDGFQYRETEGPLAKCVLCKGSGKIDASIAPPLDDDGTEWDYSDDDPVLEDEDTVECPNCDGKGQAPRQIRVAERISCPKDDLLVDLLEEHEDIGRIVIYAGFKDSVDRCVSLCLTEGWNVIRVDGRGFWNNLSLVKSEDMLEYFQNRENPKIAYVGHPRAGGMGVTLTASPTIVYYSNSFDGEARFQSEDRIHRPGADLNKGCTIIDLIHLETDEYVLDNLLKKRNLQDLTMGQLIEGIKITGERDV
jgi:SNF2 family DNA or RNA helicase